MTLEEMAEQYRQTGENCRASLRRLYDELRGRDLSETERLLLKRRICLVESMTRDAYATSRYLANYYSSEDKKIGGKRFVR